MPLVHTYHATGYGKAFLCTFSAETTADNNAFFVAAAPWGVGDVKITKDDGLVPANTTNLPVAAAGAFYRLNLTATEMSAFKVNVGINTVGTARAVWLRIVVNPVANTLTRGTLAGGAASTFTLPATDYDNNTTSVIDNFYTNTQVTIIGGTGANQTRPIASYVGATRIGTVARDWTTAPDGTSIYVIAPGADVWDIAEGTEPAGPIVNNATFRQIMQYQKRYFFNRNTQTAVLRTMYKDNSTTVLATRAATSDGITQELAKLS